MTWRDADRSLFEAVRARRSPARTKIAHAVSALAEPGVVYPVLALAGIAGAGKSARRDGRRPGARSCWWQVCAPILAVAAGSAARRGLSEVVARPRPPEAAWLARPNGFSLPSRHTALAALAAGASVRACGARGVAGSAAPAVAAAWVGASRVYLGVHWPSDVVAGWLFAESWLRLARCGGFIRRSSEHEKNMTARN